MTSPQHEEGSAALYQLLEGTFGNIWRTLFHADLDVRKRLKNKLIVVGMAAPSGSVGFLQTRSDSFRHIQVPSDSFGFLQGPTGSIWLLQAALESLSFLQGP